jgi:hypothetical protein
MEQYFKILHVPTGKYCTGHSVNQFGKDQPTPTLNKKGRLWKRFNDIVIAWKTIRKGLTDHRHPNLINDYAIQVFELTLIETVSEEKLTENIKFREASYHKRRIEQEISTTKYRIEIAKQEAMRNGNLLPKLQKELQSLTDKFQKL